MKVENKMSAFFEDRLLKIASPEELKSELVGLLKKALILRDDEGNIYLFFRHETQANQIINTQNATEAYSLLRRSYRIPEAENFEIRIVACGGPGDTSFNDRFFTSSLS